MIYENIPKTDLSVSKVAIGAMSFGAKLNKADAAEVIACAMDSGVNFIDTAHNYNGGESERILGEVLSPSARSKFVLASKVGYKVRDGKSVTDLSRDYIVATVEDSLRRMNTDYLDICYLHAPDYTTPIEESLEAMDSMVRAGKVRYNGVSNYAAWQITDMLWISENRGYAKPVVTQNVYNLLSRSLDAELKPCITEKGVGLTVFNPLAGGLLSGRHHGGKPEEGSRFAGNKMYFDRYWNDTNFSAIEALTDVARQAGVTLLELALRWCISKPHVTSVLLGMSRVQQFEQNVKIAGRGALAPEIVAMCDDVWASYHSSDVNYGR